MASVKPVGERQKTTKGGSGWFAGADSGSETSHFISEDEAGGKWILCRPCSVHRDLEDEVGRPTLLIFSWPMFRIPGLQKR